MSKEPEPIPERVEIDFNAHMGMPHHLDYSSYYPDGSLMIHMTLDPEAGPEDIVEGLEWISEHALDSFPLTPKWHEKLLTNLHRQIKKVRGQD